MCYVRYVIVIAGAKVYWFAAKENVRAEGVNLLVVVCSGATRSKDFAVSVLPFFVVSY